MAQIEKIQKLASRLFQALQLVQPKLPREIQEVMAQDSGGMSIAWTFSLTLASFALKDETGVPSSLEAIGVWRFVSGLGGLMMLVPAELKGAVATAQRGNDSQSTTDDVGKQFQAALNGLVGVQQTALIAWLKGGDFKAAAAGFQREYPESGSPDDEMEPPPKRQVNRARNFDRADLPIKRGTTTATPTVLWKAEEVPAPALTNQDITRASLHALGWSMAEVERIVAGPNGQLGEFGKWRRVLRTYVSLKKIERMKFQKIVDEVDRGFSKEEWQRVNVGDVGDLRQVEALDLKTGLELFNEFKELPVVDRMKMVRWITDNETGFTADDVRQANLGKVSPAGEV